MWRATIKRLHSLQEIGQRINIIAWAPLGHKNFMGAGNSKITSIVLLPRLQHFQD